MTNGATPANDQADFPWPLSFDSFSFGSRAYNTNRCSIIFQQQQHAVPSELDRPSGQPRWEDWRDTWSGNFMVPDDAMPPSSVEIDWEASDGSEHAVAIDLIREIFPERTVHHNVPREDVNEDWARHDKIHPDILVEVNDRTITVYMKARILTTSSAAARPDIHSRKDLVAVWSKTY